jgi:dTDP-4-dehydrorhamnose 3,5-epimerase
MKVTNTALPEILLLQPQVFRDERGLFFENWHRHRYAEQGLPTEFAQDNISFSESGVLRGLHFQNPKGQGKLVSVLEGEIFDVAVDIRVGSPRFGQWVGVTLSSENHFQLWIPSGFAHGFYVVSPKALVSYKATDFYDRDNEATLIWNDAELKIKWPSSHPKISEKDSKGFTLNELRQTRLPKF